MNTRKGHTAASRTETRPVPFAFHAPGAKHVCVTGDFTNWSREGFPLNPHTDDDWKATLRLSPGRHEYRVLVDGEWKDDPNARQVAPNPFGTMNGVIEVR